MWLSIIIGSIIIADAIIVVNGYKPWFFTWDKKKDVSDDKED